MYQPLFSAELFNMCQPFFQQTPTFHSPLGRPATPRRKRLSVASVRPGRVNMTGCWPKKCLGGGFKYFVCSTLLGEMIQFDYIICFIWVETIFLQSSQADKNKNGIIEYNEFIEWLQQPLGGLRKATVKPSGVTSFRGRSLPWSRFFQKKIGIMWLQRLPNKVCMWWWIYVDVSENSGFSPKSSMFK